MSVESKRLFSREIRRETPESHLGKNERDIPSSTHCVSEYSFFALASYSYRIKIERIHNAQEIFGIVEVSRVSRTITERYCFLFKIDFLIKSYIPIQDQVKISWFSYASVFLSFFLRYCFHFSFENFTKFFFCLRDIFKMILQFLCRFKDWFVIFCIRIFSFSRFTYVHSDWKVKYMSPTGTFSCQSKMSSRI